MNTCAHCHRPLVSVAPDMARHWSELTTGDSRRLGAHPATVCPACDSYAMGAEMTVGLPFYSEAIAAFATVHDWDWENRDPAECDVSGWPEIDGMRMSEHALRGAIAFLSEVANGALPAKTSLALQSLRPGVKRGPKKHPS